MGARTSSRPRAEKLPPDQRSQFFQFRLDPKKPADARVLQSIQAYANDGRFQDEQGYFNIGVMFRQMLAAYEGRPIDEPTVEVGAWDIQRIGEMVEHMMQRVEQGVVVNGDGQKRSRKPKAVPISDSMRATVERNLDSGSTRFEDLDED